MKLIRTLHPEIRVIDAARGICDYVASDETIDTYREVIRASGWRFNRFERNAPLVDSHNYSSISQLLGRVIDWRVDGDQLFERAQWAIDVPENSLAQVGWKMTAAGYLRAVSVGFTPTRVVSRFDTDRQPYLDTLAALGLTEESNVRSIYLEQEQIELSVCIIGANPNALARALENSDKSTLGAFPGFRQMASAYKAGVIDDADLEKIETMMNDRQIVREADKAADVSRAQQRRRLEFVMRFQAMIQNL